MASVNLAEQSEAEIGKGKIYMSCSKPRGYARQQKKVTRSGCNNRKACGTSHGNVPRKKRFKSKD